MASLLGGEYCIESLHQDVQDLQLIIDEVQSRIGRVKYQSWKFPDKAACDLNILKLLENCKYSEEDEEESQMSHVMLYDLVIDRLVYLLQTFICFNEILLNTGGEKYVSSSPAVKKGAIRSMSIGLSVKKCWARITQIATTLQKLANLTKEKPVIEAISNDHVSEKKSHEPEISPQLSPDGFSDKDVSCDVRSIGSQTAESAYATCETCSKSQESLHEVGKTIVKLCKEQSLPTALEDYQSRFNEKCPMSVADLLRWSKHQSKDLSRISRHMGNLMKQVTPLKSQLEVAMKNEKTMKSELQSGHSVFDRKVNELREEFRRKEHVSKESEKDLKKKIATLETIKSNMQDEIDKCNWKISDLKDELLQKHRDQLSIENALNLVKEEAIEGQQYKKDAVKFKTELARVNRKVEDLEQSINHDRQRYERERMKNENMAHHEKMLQDKQKSLLRRMESVNEDCDKLREQILILEEERDTSISKVEDMEKNTKDHENSFQSLQDEIGPLQEMVESLRRENEELQNSVAGYCERERLIIAYPDLNQENVESPMVQGSGNVAMDMKSQMDANVIRIEVLQKENDALHHTLNSIHSSSDYLENPENFSHRSVSTARSHIPAWSFYDDNQKNEPIQLWKTSDIPSHFDGKSDSYNMGTGDQFFSSNRNGADSEVPQRKPPSGRKNTYVQTPNHGHKRFDVPDVNGIRLTGSATHSSPSLEAYKLLKQKKKEENVTLNARSSFTVGAGRRPNTSSRPSSAKSALFKPWT